MKADILIICPYADPESVSEIVKEYIGNPHTYELEDNAVMRDLLIKVLKEIEPARESEWDDNYLYRRFIGKFGNCERDINLDFPVQEYINQNAENGFIQIYYQMALRGGWGIAITAEIWLEMPSKERGHERLPHVHIRKGKYLKGNTNENTIRVRLDDLSVMDNAEKKVAKLFKNKEWAFVMRVLSENQEMLINEYNCMMKGVLTERISLNLDEETYQTIPNIFRF